MNIDFCINNISRDRLLGKGFQNKCYNFDDVVLLESRYLSSNEIESRVNNVSSIKNILDTLDANCYKILDYKVLNDKLYILESKVKGLPLQDTSIGIDSSVYISRLKELDNYDILRKFVSDYMLLIDSGINVDPGTPNNFLFDGEKISFIDLSLGRRDDAKYVCFYIMHNILKTFCEVSVNDIDAISFYANDIYAKLCAIYKELGYDSSMYSFSPNGLISDYIDRKINDFKKDCIDLRTKSI